MSKKITLKSKKILIVILVAVLAAAAATFGFYQILTPHRATVYIFNNNYSAGTLVTQKMLTPIEVDATIVESSMAASAGDYFVTSANYQNVLSSAGVLRSDVHSGNPLMTSMLTTTGGNSIEMTMKQDAVAVTVPASYITAVTEEISAGSRVNVYVSYDSSTTLLLESARVLSVSYGGGSVSAVTLEVNIPESLELVHAATYGSIYFGLVDATGYQYSGRDNLTYNTTGFSVND